MNQLNEIYRNMTKCKKKNNFNKITFLLSIKNKQITV